MPTVTLTEEPSRSARWMVRSTLGAGRFGMPASAVVAHKPAIGTNPMGRPAFDKRLTSS